MVYILDIAGKPLMPTERHGKVRRLLRDGKAHVVRLIPFTIQLDYESTTYRQEVSLGVDAGSVHIGMSVTTQKKELFAAEVVLRNDIVKKMQADWNYEEIAVIVRPVIVRKDLVIVVEKKDG